MAIAVSAATASAGATDAPDGSERLQVGRTGILCVRAPCPWRGVTVSDPARGGPGQVLWSGEGPPPLVAAKGDAERIVTAWTQGACLVVDGAWGQGALRVDRVIGDCP